jgi:HD-like signal output (HDOD) protein
MGTDHCEIGTRFARANALPRPVASAIWHHHDPGAEKEYPILVALTAAADALANYVQRERKLTNFGRSGAPALYYYETCSDPKWSATCGRRCPPPSWTLCVKRGPC